MYSIFLASLVLLTSSQAYAQINSDEDTQKRDPTTRFVVTTEADDQIAGVLQIVALRVEFSSHMETPSRAVIQVQLSEVILEAQADEVSDTRTLDSHGHELSEDERSALAALAADLKEYLRLDDRGLFPHEELLLRAVSFWAEARVGWPLLDVSAHSGDEITGAFRSDRRSIAHFGSLDLSFASRMLTPWRIVLELQLGDHSLTADVDLQRKIAKLEGSGRALSAEQLQTLENFAAQYERYLTPDQRDPLRHEDMFYRVISVWAQYPAGHT
jgi:hypothetical protein